MPTRRKRRLKASPSPAPDTPETSFRPGQPLELRTSCISKPSIEPPMSNPAGSDHPHPSRPSSSRSAPPHASRLRCLHPGCRIARAAVADYAAAHPHDDRTKPPGTSCHTSPHGRTATRPHPHLKLHLSSDRTLPARAPPGHARAGLDPWQHGRHPTAPGPPLQAGPAHTPSDPGARASDLPAPPEARGFTPPTPSS